MSTAAGLAAWVLTAATPAPGSQDVNPTDGGSPGFVGFLVTFAVALVVIGLAFSLVRTMRRMEHNSRQREASGAARAVAQPQEPTGPTGPTGPVEPPTAVSDDVVGPPAPSGPPAG